MSPMPSCKKDGSSNGDDYEVKSSCDGGDGYLCNNLAPWKVSDTVSYGYAASGSGDICGKCYQLQFTGKGHYSDTPGAVALAGKTMIVQLISLGYDVSGGQFDILIPGGGVGVFNACSNKWNIPNSEFGAAYGGFLTACQQQLGYYDHDALKACVKAKGQSVFRDRGIDDMADGVDWFVDWFMAADNPNLVYKEIECPAELIEKSSMCRPD